MHFPLRNKSLGLFLDIAPLLDVVFLLLIFFIIGAQFLRPVLDLDLPKAKGQGYSKSNSIILSIDQEKKIYVDGVLTSIGNLTRHIDFSIKKKKQNDVIIQVDRNTPFSLFIEVMEKIRQMGIKRINIETTPYYSTTILVFPSIVVVTDKRIKYYELEGA